MSFQLKGTGRTVTEGIRFVKCGACGRAVDPLPVMGDGKERILIVFDQPTAVQKERKSWFAGGNSTVLKLLTALGLNLVKDVWVTAVLPCYGGHSDAIKYEPCLPKLQETLDSCKPNVIIPVGPVATGAILRLYNPGHYAPNHATAQFYGQFIPLTAQSWKSWLAPVQSDKEIHIYHNEKMQGVAKDWVKRSLEYAVQHAAIPLPEIPSPNEELLYQSSDIVAVLQDAAQAKYVAFDYETNCFQPEQPDSKVLTAGITVETPGKPLRTVAFPMSSSIVIEAWKQFLASPVPKIGANIKFEHRWSSVWFQTPVANWKWDVCIGGRIMDCSPGNSGLKYLTFVNFGISGYDDSVEPYMKDDANGHNLLEKANVTELLTYNAYDAYWTLQCFHKQCADLLLRC